MFKVKWTPQAEERYIEILAFWINHNKSDSYSLKIIDEVERQEQLLKINPYIGAVVFGTKEEIRRVLVLHNFSVFYRIQNSVVEIVSFWSNKNNPQELNL